MSYDLVVYASRRPSELMATPGVIEVDQPVRAEVDDIPDVALAATLAPAWQVEIHAPLGARAEQRARALAREIADTAWGVVYDPQKDAVIWPRGGRRDFPARSREERRVTVLVLTWCVARRLSSADCAIFLRAVRRLLPEGVPSRWGTSEPLQGTGDADFCGSWDGKEGPFWKGRPPVLGGGVSLGRAARSYVRRPPRLVDSIRLDIDADATILASDQWQKSISNALSRIAPALGAFFACAHLEPGWIAQRGALWADGREVTRSVVADGWMGLPWFPCWLMWLGPEYASLAEHLGDGSVSRTPQDKGTGCMLASPSPLDPIDAATHGLSASLLRARGSRANDGEAEVIPRISWEDDGPAA